MIAFLRRLKDRLTTLAPTSLAEHWHDWLMFVVGVLCLIGLTVGWHHPDRLSAFSDALSKLPPQAWEVFAAIIGIPTLRRILSAPDQ